MASNPQIESVPYTEANPHHHCLSFVRSQVENHKTYAAEGAKELDEWIKDAELWYADDKGNIRRRRKLENAFGLEKDGDEGSSQPGESEGMGSGVGSSTTKKKRGISKGMRDRNGNLPSPLAKKAKNSETGRPSPLAGNQPLKDFSFHLHPPSPLPDIPGSRPHPPATPKILTAKQIAAQMNLNLDSHPEDKRRKSNKIKAVDSLAPAPLGETKSKQDRIKSKSPPRVKSDMQTARSDHEDKTIPRGKKRKGDLQKISDQGDDENDADCAGRGGRKRSRQAGAVKRGKEVASKNDVHAAESEGDEDREREALLQQRKLKRREKASILRSKPLEPKAELKATEKANAKGDSSKNKINPPGPKTKTRGERETALYTTPNPYVRSTRRTVKDSGRDRIPAVTAVDDGEDESDIQDVIVVSPAKPQAKPKANGKIKAQDHDQKEDKGTANKKGKEEKKMSAVTVTVAKGGRQATGAGLFGMEPMERPNTRITLRPTRGVFQRGIASANLPIKSKKVPPVPDLAFCESTFLSRPKRNTRQRKAVSDQSSELSEPDVERKRTQSRPQRKGRDGQGKAAEVDTEPESSELSSAPPSDHDDEQMQVDGDSDAGGSNEQVGVEARSYTASTRSSPRIKVRQPVKTAKSRDLRGIEKQEIVKKTEQTGGRHSSEWPSSLPDEDMPHARSEQVQTKIVPPTTRRISLGRQRISVTPSDAALSSRRARRSAAPEIIQNEDHDMNMDVDSLPMAVAGPSQQIKTRRSVRQQQIQSLDSQAAEEEEDHLLEIIQDAMVPVGARTRSKGNGQAASTKLVRNRRISRPEYSAQQDHERMAVYGNDEMYDPSALGQIPWQPDAVHLPIDKADFGIQAAQAMLDGRMAARDSGDDDEDLHLDGRDSEGQDWMDSSGSGDAMEQDRNQDEMGMMDGLDMDLTGQGSPEMKMDGHCPGMEQYEKSDGLMIARSEIIDMFGTTSHEAKKLWQNGRRS